MGYMDLLEEYNGLVPLDDPRVEAVDWAPHLGIIKWEPVLPANMAGQVKGLFPSFIRKTDQERCQNIIDEIFIDNKDARYEVTIKLDGSSVTFYHLNSDVGVCSRNLELKINDENSSNTLIKIFLENELQHVLPTLGNIAIQGEMIGEGIQGNAERIKGQEFYVFDIQNIDEQCYMSPANRAEVVLKLQELAPGIKHVPILNSGITLAELGIFNIEDLLKFADGKSLNADRREGLVFKRMDGKFSFKSISNAWLIKND